MKLKRICMSVFLILVVMLGPAPFFPCLRAEECSTAIITGEATPDQRPILWKNRDTDQLDNKVVYVSEVPYSYIGLVNAVSDSGRHAWCGLNSAGLAVMNSVAYNLPQKSGESVDMEGILMADVLRTCKSTQEVESYIKKNLGSELGVRANFGVIDAFSGAALFEVHNHGYQRLDILDYPEKYLINTNFSRSGEPEKGRGLLRFDRLQTLFQTIPDGQITAALILQKICRDLGHSLLKHPDSASWTQYPPDTPVYLYANHTINRSSTAAAVVFVGVRQGEDPARSLMWVIPGEPVCGVAIPLWADAGEVPGEISAGKSAPMFLETMRLKKRLRPFRDAERFDYLDLTKLDNRAGSGWLPSHLKLEREIFEKTEQFLNTNPGRSQKAEFQRRIAAEVLAYLKSIGD